MRNNGTGHIERIRMLAEIHRRHTEKAGASLIVVSEEDGKKIPATSPRSIRWTRSGGNQMIPEQPKKIPAVRELIEQGALVQTSRRAFGKNCEGRELIPIQDACLAIRDDHSVVMIEHNKVTPIDKQAAAVRQVKLSLMRNMASMGEKTTLPDGSQGKPILFQNDQRGPSIQ